MFGLDDAIAAALRIVDKVIPDPAAKAAAQMEVIKMKQAGDFKELDTQLAEMQMQADINKVEAASSSVWVAGWRPYIGWVCGAALTYQYIVRPFLIGVFGYTAMPGLDDNLWQLLLGMLGIGGLRTFEKVKGVAK